MREITVAQAINEALAEEIILNKEVFVIGEDVGLFGGCFGVTTGLYSRFPENVIDTPISEAGVMGLAAGAAYMGVKMVPELMFSDFVGVAMDYFLNQISKSRYMGGMQPEGKECCVVVRLPSGAGLTAASQHSQCTEALLMNIPGLKIVMPSTPADFKGMLKYAIRGKDPVAFFEHKLLYGIKGEVPDEDYIIPFGLADVKREGTDVTVIATQMMVHKSLSVAAKLAKEGISVEVVDPRSLKPLDTKTIVASVKKTGRVVLVNEAPEFGNALAEVGMQISELAHDDLKTAPVRVCGPDRPIPFSPALENKWIVSEDDIIEGIKKSLKLVESK
jgi:pyruvate dehydrogenase E1 component beta subunit